MDGVKMEQFEAKPLERPWVKWTAQQIADPVGRLRFLQAVAPCAEEPKAKRRGRAMVWVGLLLLTGAGIPLSRTVVKAQGRSVAPTAVEVMAPAVVEMVAPVPQAAAGMATDPAERAEIWQVEGTTEFAIYSNGLRIENRYATGTRRRSYLSFDVARPDDLRGEAGSVPVGIVFHTTESLQAPFEASQNALLKRAGESLAAYVKRRHSYNFLIDRFGRVYRVVLESDVADHAGHSVWANDERFYVNLNESFLGVSLEARTAAGGPAETQVSPAQLRAVAMLTEMLRKRYHIPAKNCVTHAQVSVNPANMQVGYHTDWASSFPFESVGLPDNYGAASPALRLFGFQFDASFAHRGGARLRESAARTEREMRERAAVEGVTLAAYRKRLQNRYWALVGIVRRGATVGSDVE